MEASGTDVGDRRRGSTSSAVSDDDEKSGDFDSSNIDIGDAKGHIDINSDNERVSVRSDSARDLLTERSETSKIQDTFTTALDRDIKMHPFHRNVLETLKSSKFLSPTYVDVRNLSYWYLNRKQLGPKRQNALLTKQNKISERWEAGIYQLKPRDEDLVIVPTRHMLKGDHKTRWLAYKAAEAAGKDRDANPAENKKLAIALQPDHILCTHLRVIIVSKRFYGLNNTERLALVYEELIQRLGVRARPMETVKSSKRHADQPSALSTDITQSSFPTTLSQLKHTKSAPAGSLSHGPVNHTTEDASHSSSPNGDRHSSDGNFETVFDFQSLKPHMEPLPQKKHKHATFADDKLETELEPLPPTPHVLATAAGGGVIDAVEKGPVADRSSPISPGKGPQRPMTSPSLSTSATTGINREHDKKSDLSSGVATCPPSSMKLATVFGQNVCNLELFHFYLPEISCKLIIETKTPSQWRPDLYPPPLVEKVGDTRTEVKSLQVGDFARPAAIKERVRMLAKNPPNINPLFAEALEEKARQEEKAKKQKQQKQTAKKKKGKNAAAAAGGSAAAGASDSEKSNAGKAKAMRPTVADSGSTIAETASTTAVGEGRKSTAAGDKVSSNGDPSAAAATASKQGSTLPPLQKDRRNSSPKKVSVSLPPLNIQSSNFTGTGAAAGPGADAVPSATSSARSSVSVSTSVHDGAAAAGGGKSHRENYSIYDILGVDPTIATSMTVLQQPSLLEDSNVQKKKKFRTGGGIFGHFFKDMSSEVKKLVMQRVKENKQLIQREGHLTADQLAEIKKQKAAKREFQPKTNLLLAREREAYLGEYDKGTSSEHEMLEQFYMTAKKLERVAVRVQRMWRINAIRKAAKLVWRRKYAILQIQRVARGRFARTYVAMVRKLRPLAASRIQLAYRRMWSRIIREKWFWLTRRLTRVILPKMKRFIMNLFYSLTRDRDEQKKATKIQSLIRRYNCRAWYLRQKGERLFLRVLAPRAAIQIQRIVRGRVGRRLFRERMDVVLKERIDLPAVRRMQRIFRGHLGRRKAARRRLEIASANLLQRVGRAFVRRVWERQMAEERHRIACAIEIQRVFRGRLDREIYFHRREKWIFENITIPAAIRLQSWARKILAMRYYELLKKQTAAATVIQKRYRRFRRRKEAVKRWRAAKLAFKSKNAIKIQSLVRGMLTRMMFKRKSMEYKATVIFASRIIMRAWMNYKSSKMFQELLHRHRVKTHQEKIATCDEAREELLEDIEEIRYDISNTNDVINRNKNRIKLLDQFQINASLRRPEILKQLAGVTEEDKAAGWEEAYTNEYESLGQQMIMAKEEQRLLRADILKRNEELKLLNQELEEAYIELDNLGTMEIEAIEVLHRSEYVSAERKINFRLEKAVRLERCRWKIRGNRVNVLKRRLDKETAATIAAANKNRDMAFAETITYERRAQEREREKLIAAIKNKLAGASRGQGVRTYEDYVVPVTKTFDNVVANNLSLLRGWSLDERARRVQEETKQKEAATRRLHGGQFAPLKEEYQKKRAFDYLRHGN